MIGHKYYGAISYAESLMIYILIAPSTYALNKMCDICLEFASEYDLQFYLSKCQLNMAVVQIPPFTLMVHK